MIHWNERITNQQPRKAPYILAFYLFNWFDNQRSLCALCLGHCIKQINKKSIEHVLISLIFANKPTTLCRDLLVSILFYSCDYVCKRISKKNGKQSKMIKSHFAGHEWRSNVCFHSNSKFTHHLCVNMIHHLLRAAEKTLRWTTGTGSIWIRKQIQWRFYIRFFILYFWSWRWLTATSVRRTLNFANLFK